jgi:hypothetical protein
MNLNQSAFLFDNEQYKPWYLLYRARARLLLMSQILVITSNHKCDAELSVKGSSI